MGEHAAQSLQSLHRTGAGQYRAHPGMERERLTDLMIEALWSDDIIVDDLDLKTPLGSWGQMFDQFP